MPPYLVKLVPNHPLVNFRLPEFDACLEFFGIDPGQAYDRTQAAVVAEEGGAVYVVVELPSEEAARRLQARCIMADKVLELWGHGTDYPALAASLALLPPEFLAPYMAASRSWSLLVEGTMKTLSMAEQDAARKKVLVQLPFEGKISLRTPDTRYWLMEDYPISTAAAPRRVFFGRELPGVVRARDLVGLGDLKQRAYLGPTSLDNEVALLMASFAHVRKGSLVLDPFVGTGSILIACAQFGARLCVGTDIDIRVLRGKKGRNIFSNFKQYGLPPPDLVRSDNALYGGHFRALPLYDAVVCDPPYGIRAGARRSGSRREEVKPIPDHLRADHIPQTRPYPVNDVMQDLLVMAATVLKPGGRLVYLLPVDLSPDAPPPPDPLIPEHPGMELVEVMDQVCTSKLIRKMVVMRKRAEGAAGAAAAGGGVGEGEEREQKRHCAEGGTGE